MATSEPGRGQAPAPAEASASPVATAPVSGVWALAWPAITGNLLYSLVGLVDTKIVASLGAEAVAATTTGHRVFFVLQAVLMGVTAGTTAMVARAWGAGDRDEAERVTRCSLWLCLGVAGALTLPGVLFPRALAGVFRLDPQALELAATFIFWISVFNLGFAVFFVLGTALRAAGDTRTPLLLGALANVINVALLSVLVHGNLGFPALGVAGAAIANGVSFSLGAALTLVLWLRGSLRVGPGSGPSIARERMRRLVRIGTPAGIEQAVWQSGFIVFLWIVALYGTAPYAAYGIGVSILSFSFVVGFGFSIAASTLVGQRLGASDPDGATREGWRAMRLSVGAMVVLGLTIVLAARSIAEFMIDDPEVVRLTVTFIHILGAVQPLMAIEFSLGGALRGAGDTRFPLLAVLSGLFGARIAIAGVCTVLGTDVEWIYGALVFDYIVKSTMLTLRFRRGRWKKIVV